MSNLAAVFQIGYLGDSIMSVPALHSLRELLPDCSEYIMVDRVDHHLKIVPSQVFSMAWEPKHRVYYRGAGSRWKRIASTGTLLGALRYFRPRYAAYLLPADRAGKQVERDRLFFRAGGIRELVGFRALDQGELSHSGCPTFTCSEAYLRLRRLWGKAADEKFGKYAVTPMLTPPEAAHRTVGRWLQQNRRFPDRRLVAIAPFSNDSARHWPSPYIATLLTSLEQKLGVETVIIGGSKDFESAAAAVKGAGDTLNACGAFSVMESAALLKQCSLLISAESGPMHLAGALGVGTIAIFSRVAPNLCRWLPLGKGHTVLYRNVSCAGCGNKVCPVAGHPCLTGITPEEVFSVATERLAGRPVAAKSPFGSTVLNW